MQTKSIFKIKRISNLKNVLALISLRGLVRVSAFKAARLVTSEKR